MTIPTCTSRVRCIHNFSLFPSKRISANMNLIRFICACFRTFVNTIYSHQLLHIRFKIFAQICMQLFIFSYWRIFASKYLFSSEYSQNFKQTLHSSEYSLANIHIQANILLQVFTKYCFKLYRKGFHKSKASIDIRFILHVKSADLLRYETNK